jgi:opacity protein-like surface antigen
MKCAITLTRASLLVVGVAILTLCNPYHAVAQSLVDNLEVSGGYNHTSGDFGLNGFNLGTGLWVNRRVSLNLDYDWTGTNSTLGVLSLTSIGHTAIKNRLQDWLVGPRIFFPTRSIKHYKFDPFAELKLGGAHLSQRIQQTLQPSESASANSFAWVLGGGTDYQFNSQWFGRADLGYMRTHFADAGQGRWRLILGVGYTFGPRPSSR